MEKALPNNLSRAVRASFENGARLLEDAQNLLEYGRFPTSYALSILAQEECAKAFLLYLVQIEAIPWNSHVWRVLRNHTCKHLLASIMEYLETEWEEYLATLKGDVKTRFPPHIADAMNIIRYEKVPRQDAAHWLWDDERPCDPQARCIAKGKIDSQKQSALYVDVSKNGQVSSTPLNTTEEAAMAELKKAQRLSGILYGTDEHVKAFETIEYLKVCDTFRLLFGLITAEQYSNRW